MEWTAKQAAEAADNFLFDKNKSRIDECLAIIKDKSIAGERLILLPICKFIIGYENPTFNEDDKYIIDYLTKLGYNVCYRYTNLDKECNPWSNHNRMKINIGVTF
jgi:hypothetical protein